MSNDKDLPIQPTPPSIKNFCTQLDYVPKEFRLGFEARISDSTQTDHTYEVK